MIVEVLEYWEGHPDLSLQEYMRKRGWYDYDHNIREAERVRAISEH